MQTITATREHLKDARRYGADRNSSWRKMLAQSNDGPQKRAVFEALARDLLDLKGDAPEEAVNQIADAFWAGVGSARITRRGFRGAPASVRQQAEAILDSYEGDILAQLRPSAYCGPDSPGARGAYTLDAHTEHGQVLRFITPQE